MWVLVNWAMLACATVIAGAAAVAVYWLLLRATVELMRPAVVRPMGRLAATQPGVPTTGRGVDRGR
jgi:hypothetical protein